jgi:hypothetical protein
MAITEIQRLLDTRHTLRSRIHAMLLGAKGRLPTKTERITKHVLETTFSPKTVVEEPTTPVNNYPWRWLTRN